MYFLDSCESCILFFQHSLRFMVKLYFLSVVALNAVLFRHYFTENNIEIVMIKYPKVLKKLTRKIYRRLKLLIPTFSSVHRLGSQNT